MSPTTKNVANAVGGKTARACDNCITKRARWYCAADDAFLCQACDSSVHSANSLARRHERVRLKTASSSTTDAEPPTWHHGFTKKARTPRQHGKHSRQTIKSSSSNAAPSSVMRNPFHLVPEVGSDEVNSSSHEENEAQLLYRVPIFDPFVAELCRPDPPSSSSVTSTDQLGGRVASEVENKCNKVQSDDVNNHHDIESCFQSGLLLLHPSDIELAEFAADVESLLGRGLENEYMGMEELGLVDNTKQVHEDQESWECSVKVESEEAGCCKEMGKESTFELNFDYDDDSRESCEEVKVKEKVEGEQKENNNSKGKRKICLQLDYEAVIIAWDGQKKCPWTTGDKPNLDDEYWPDHYMGSKGTELYYSYYGSELGGFGCHPAMLDGGREARVSRYREKRRTRLFSKKIRYEVRKLNAEKRPRMKGRFVKRTSFESPTFPLLK